MSHYHIQKVDLKSLKYIDLALSGGKKQTGENQPLQIGNV